MTFSSAPLLYRIWFSILALSAILVATGFLGIAMGSGIGLTETVRLLLDKDQDTGMLSAIIWQIRFPRVLLAALAGGALSLGGLVFQGLLRNPLAEPYILGISGGAAVGAIIGILLGLSRIPGVAVLAFGGGMATLALVLFMSGGRSLMKRDSLLLSGVMVNAFCSAVIMFLVSLTQDARLHNIIYWLMGDLSMADLGEIGVLAILLPPCFLIVFGFSHSMNLMLMGGETARTMGVNARITTLVLLIVTSFMVGVSVAYCGLLGFIGLVVPHLLRLILGPDHRVLVPACVLGGAAFLTGCDLLARVLPRHGEMPAGVITAMIGAPLFIVLLKKARR